MGGFGEFNSSPWMIKPVNECSEYELMPELLFPNDHSLVKARFTIDHFNLFIG